MNRRELGLSSLCIALLLVALVFANQIEMERRTISDLQQQVSALENSTGMIEARTKPQMWSQWGSPPWQSFQFDVLPYGFHVVAADSTNGTNYICNRAFGYFIIDTLPNHLWITGRVKLDDSAQSGQSWSRIAFVMAVDHGETKSFLELDVYDSLNSPVQPEKPGIWSEVHEYNKYQLRVGEERVFTFDIGWEYRNNYADRSYADILNIHLYFVLECETATNGGWSIAYSVDDMGFWETT
jgi:hypothetical protein